MDLQTSIYENIIDPAVADDVIPLCELAKNFEGAGEFDRAAETLRPFWSGLLNRPNTKGLSDRGAGGVVAQNWNPHRLARKCKTSSWCSGGCQGSY